MADLREAMRRRVTWFYETQLRALNCGSFQGLRPDKPGAMLDLVSEVPLTAVFPGQFGRLQELPRVYLDSQQPVWTNLDAQRHGEFDASLLGRMGDWLYAREPQRLGSKLKALQDEFEATRFGSNTDSMPSLSRFPRRRPDDMLGDHHGDAVAAAISRAELAAARPWLIPELYNFVAPEAADEGRADIRAWVANLERYVHEFETELALSVGGVAGVEVPFATEAPELYRAFLAGILSATSARPASDAVKVRLLDLFKDKPQDKSAKYHYVPSIATNGAAMGPVETFALSARVGYWTRAFLDSQRECIVLKPNSDMGLCQLVRLIYRYGTIPDGVGAEPGWRHRLPPDDTYRAFMQERVKVIGDDTDLLARFEKAEVKLRIILEESAAHPRSPDPSFSPLAGEVLKQALLSYKFWLDEHPRALDNDRLNKVKRDLGYADDEIDHEMEFWSENHYIMFASSEYLLGQLWQEDAFQPCRLFVDPGDRTGERTGLQRRDRGRVRVLKWLNNRLMFGWMEFHSSGYYREHLWALLNLVDFALDDEVRTKAVMAVDLMLFDATRFQHRGAMGAAGGRSQFKSKSSGFDNGLSDVLEIMFGVKGVYVDGDAQIGASFASSAYPAPQALLEMGVNPPTAPFTDRSRVSITFDESGKYGITWSQDSDTKDSQLVGYAAKRARYSPFLAEVNREIARTHDDYGAVEDDTIFFWGMSAFVNKQVVRGSFALMHRYGLDKADAFKQPRLLMGLVSLFKDLPSQLFYTATGEPLGDIDERTADDLSLVFEGSTRTRANIVTYRSPGAMLSSLQNFRAGQLNFQTSVQQATLNGALNVFVTAGFGDIDLSELATFTAGFLVGGALGSLFGPVGAVIGSVAGGIGAVAGEHAALEDTNPLCPGHDDGPDWWTGNWALPRVVQHAGATIMLSDFHDMQKFLADVGSHAWFPRSGFDQVVERRTGAYDDANFPLLDIGHIGPKGFWLFGKVVHPTPEGSTDLPEEGYVGVFSNNRPEWMTRESGPYDHRIEQQIDKDKDKGNADIWKDAPDLFAGRDWHVDGKNIWIVQIGSRNEFGSFNAFMDRVAGARVHIDDDGDLECTYDAPLPGGGSARLRLADGDDPEFELNGQPLATDLFPRFETPFVRGGLVEWQQRAYCLEWNGHSLLHDFLDMRTPVRGEDPDILDGDSRTIRALVIYLRTGDEAMEAFTVATARVDIGCTSAARAQVVAAGPVSENTQHDAEWIYFDRPMRRSPDMTLEIVNPPGGGDPFDLGLPGPGTLPDVDPATLGRSLLRLVDGSPEWKATFTLKALMGDHQLRDCALVFDQIDFEDDRRSSGARPFAIRLGEWDEWQPVGGAIDIASWLLAAHPPFTVVWHDHNDLFALDHSRRLWWRRMRCGGALGFWSEIKGAGDAPDWSLPFSWSAVSDSSGRVALFVISGGRLLAWVEDVGSEQQPWVDLQPTTLDVIFPVAVPLAPSSTVTPVPTGSGFADLYVLGADGAVYVRHGWGPGDAETWRRIGIEDLGGDTPSQLGVGGGQVIARTAQGNFWICRADLPTVFGAGWTPLDSPGFPVSAFSAIGNDMSFRLAAQGPDGEIAIGSGTLSGTITWQVASADDAWRPTLGSDLVWAAPAADTTQLFAIGSDGSVRSLVAGEAIWRSVGPGVAPDTQATSRLAATCRTAGQIELFADVGGETLVWTWWS
ncbi:MAG TPA: hypothetical protein VGN46_18295 [Luteibacter sp.]|uniref:hypothetical protein n=1 Tax=Luteibacter sp. TaxID=1886636 RepID=UPI002F3ED814